jgi:hypothetical protein
VRLRILLLLALTISGCTIPTEPNYPQTNSWGSTGYNDFYLDRSPIPNTNYDGLFVAQFHNYDYLDSAGVDVLDYSYDAQSILYNALHNIIDIPSESLSIQVDGTGLLFKPYYQYDTNIHLDFPSPVSWVMSGDNYFPSFSHNISSEDPIEILSPPLADSLEANADFDIAYNAPGADSVTVTLQYDGIGINKYDTTNQVREYLFNQQISTANTGHYSVPGFTLDTKLWKTYNPQSLLVSVAWAQGDTIHGAGKIFGFVTEVSNSREYYFKQ